MTEIKSTVVDDVTLTPGAVLFRVRWLDGDKPRNHRAHLPVGGDLAELVAAIDAKRGEHPAIGAEDVAAIEAALEACPPAPAETPLTPEQLVARINQERDRRIAGGFDHDGHRFQSRQSDRENIIRKGDRADAAVLAGAVADDLLWDVTTEGQDFVFITADNASLSRDAFQMVALRDAGERFKQAVTFYARGLKDAVLAAETDAERTAILVTADWPT